MAGILFASIGLGVDKFLESRDRKKSEKLEKRKALMVCCSPLFSSFSLHSLSKYNYQLHILTASPHRIITTHPSPLLKSLLEIDWHGANAVALKSTTTLSAGTANPPAGEDRQFMKQI